MPPRSIQQFAGGSRGRSSRFPLQCEWRDGLNPLGGLTARSGQAITCARGGTVGAPTTVDANGVLRQVGSHEPRFYHQYDPANGLWTSRGILFEGARINGLTQTADLSTGTVLNNVTLGTDATIAPDGTITAEKIKEDNSNNEHGVSRTTVPATTANTLQAVSVFVKAGERTWCVLSTVNRDGAVWRTWFNLSTGVFGTTNANHTPYVLSRQVNGFYRLGIVFNSGAAAGALQWATNCATADGTLTYVGTTDSGIYAWGRQWDADKSFPSSFIPTVASAVTRSLDSCSLPWNVAPAACSGYHEFTELGWGRLANATGLVIGALSGTGPYIVIQGDGAGNFTGSYRPAGTDRQSTVALGAALGDKVVLYWTLSDAGQFKLYGSLNGGAIVTGTTPAAEPLPAAWQSQTIHLAPASVWGAAFAARQSDRIAVGVQSMAFMAAA